MAGSEKLPDFFVDKCIRLYYDCIQENCDREPSVSAVKKLVITPKKYRGTTMVVSARLPGDLVTAIDQAAKRTGYNRNEILEKCLIFAIENMETGEGRNG